METITKEVHRPIIKPKKYRKVVSYHVNNIWALDLVEMLEFKDNNNGYNYILTCIDLYSRYAWAKPLKNKTAIEVKNAIESIIKETKAYPQKFYVDEGKEFYNKTLDNLRNKLHIDMYSTYGPAKASVIERFNRTFKSLMYKKFTLNQNRVWYNIIDELLDVYNNSAHRSLKNNSPSDIYNNKISIDRPELKEKDKNKPKFKLGDRVRISYKLRPVFDKGYLPNWSYEIFTITEILNTNPITYKIKDYGGEEIKGSFYKEELQLTKQPEDFYLVEKVIEKKKVKGKTQYLVKWLGYDEKYNSWINEEEFKKMKE